MPLKGSADACSAAILIVSDTAHRDASTDRTGDILTKVFEDSETSKWNIYDKHIAPDDASDIQAYLKKVAGKCNLVVTTGGTGFFTKDVTPEAVDELLEKKAPGLVHGMLAASLKVTPCMFVGATSLIRQLTVTVAMMSRPVAGVYKGTIIVTLPGSPKGAKENLEAVLPLLPHACQQASGTDSRALHVGGVKQLEKEAGVGSGAAASDHSHSHNHHHHHDHSHNHSHGHGHAIPIPHTKPGDRPQRSNNPSLGASRRYRESPYPMLKCDDAIKIITQRVPAPKITTKPVSSDLCNYVLAEDVVSKEAVPAFRASIVDGYAINLSAESGSKGVFDIAAVSHAAPGEMLPLERGKIARVTTGAPLPPNATSVVMVEDTVLIFASPEGEELQVEILTNDVKPDENVREVGSDVALGTMILQRGETISPTGGELGLLASAGVRAVKVYSRPVVGVMSTGDEIVPHDTDRALRLGEVRDTNRMTLLAALRSWSYDVADLGIAPDDADALEARIRDGLRRCDVLVTTGGASMGEADLLKPVLERRLGATIHFGRVRMKPGKPTTFMTVHVKDAATGTDTVKPVFSLPGNPASAVVSAAVFAIPGLLTMSGTAPPPPPNLLGLPSVPVVLQESVRCDAARDEYVRASVTVRAASADWDSRLVARTTGGQRSSRVGSLARANGLLVLPAGGGEIAAGATVNCLLIGQIAGL